MVSDKLDRNIRILYYSVKFWTIPSYYAPSYLHESEA